MNSNEPNYRSALVDFNQARMLASMQEVLARLTGKSNELLSYEEVAQKLKLNIRAEGGVHDIPLNSIVGSVGRYTDFNRSFLPLQGNDQERERWARVKAAIDDPSGAGWPAIDVYKVGEVYFVLDGNHRVTSDDVRRSAVRAIGNERHNARHRELRRIACCRGGG